MMLKGNHNQGFTLIELLVVIAIISLLSSVIMSSLNSARAKSRDARRLQDLVQMRTALELYAQDNDGKYPVNRLNGNFYLGWVATGPGCYPATNGVGGYVVADGLVSGKYISKVPEDPKPRTGGYCYLYFATQTGNEYKLWVNGTVETFNPQATQHPLREPKGAAYSFAIVTPVDPEDVE